ncbi:hypothetical protein GCM10010191_42710 [Actinomadura vinacea]|uniref:Uncharacterized protein n=1 Tax=Actinomadura vinacea TaxID=115336 RepID=A0ABP5WEL1_9ACTN
MAEPKKSIYIASGESLPPYKPPTGRWAEPFYSQDERRWVAYLRHPLSMAEENDRLRTKVSGVTKEEVLKEMETQDEKARELQTARGYLYGNTL